MRAANSVPPKHAPGAIAFPIARLNAVKVLGRNMRVPVISFLTAGGGLKDDQVLAPCLSSGQSCTILSMSTVC